MNPQDNTTAGGETKKTLKEHFQAFFSRENRELVYDPGLGIMVLFMCLSILAAVFSGTADTQTEAPETPAVTEVAEQEGSDEMTGEAEVTEEETTEEAESTEEAPAEE